MLVESLPGYCLGPLVGLAVNSALALLCLVIWSIYAGYPPLKPLFFFYLNLTGYFLGMTVWEMQADPAWIRRGYQAMLVALAWLPVTWCHLLASLAGRKWSGLLRAAVLLAGGLTLLLLMVSHPWVLGPHLLLHLDGRTLRPESHLLKPFIYALDMGALLISAIFLLRPKSWPDWHRPQWSWAVLAGLVFWMAGGGNDILHALDQPWALDPPILWVASIWLSLCLASAVALHLHQLEDAVRGSEEKYRTILASIHEGYYEVDFKGDLVFFNQALCRITGYPAEELRGLNNRAYMDQDTARQVYQTFNQVAQTGQVVESLEYPLRRKDGGLCHVEVSVALRQDAKGEPVGFRGMARDVTTRKLAQLKLLEKQAELHALAKEVIRVQESERRRIAQDLHDGVGQYLLASKLRLEQLAGQSPAELRPHIDLAISLIAQAVADTRSLTAQLCPPALWELGLREALSWLAEQSRERFGLEVSLDIPNAPLDLDEEMRAALFRSASELLHNVAKHARASRAMVGLGGDAGQVWLRVWDDGVGMADELRQADSQGGLGLFSIRERLALLGGKMEIQSAPGQGSRVTLHLPLDPVTREQGVWYGHNRAAGR